MQKTKSVHASIFRLRCVGACFFLFGLGNDCIIGLALLHAFSWPLLLLHIPTTCLWLLGIVLLNSKSTRAIAVKQALLNKWSIAALCLSLGLFPGAGTYAYSVALAVVALFQQKERILTTITMTIPIIPVIKRPDTGRKQLIETLYSTDLEVRRTTLAALGKQPSPQTSHLLRQMLVDPQPEIRSDASILLTRLEEKLSLQLHTALKAWEAQPTSESALRLVQQYYEYAASNVLDKHSQRFYYLKAQDLLRPLLQTHAHDAGLWLQSARISAALGADEEALHAVQQALRFQPQMQEAYILALDLAFRTAQWDLLTELVGRKSVLTTSVKQNAALQWWSQGTQAQLIGGGSRG